MAGYTNTLGGMGYTEVGLLFNQNTSLDSNFTRACSGSVKDRFEYYFLSVSRMEQAAIIRVVVERFPPNGMYKHRTQELFDWLLLAAEQLSVPAEVKAAFKLFGFDVNAGFDSVKAAYKSKLKKCHPDKVDGLSQRIKDVAEEETKELNAAYHTLKAYYESAA